MQCLYTPDVVLEAFQDVLNTIQDNIRKIKQELDALTDIGFDKFKELACSVKGIGEKSAQLLYTYTNGFELFTNSKQLVKFVQHRAFDSSIGFFCVSKRTHFKSWSLKLGQFFSMLQEQLYDSIKNVKNFSIDSDQKESHTR
ncbi:MAG: hypothetical protein R3E32_14715 [Chitinophagales bacterium]